MRQTLVRVTAITLISCFLPQWAIRRVPMGPQDLLDEDENDQPADLPTAAKDVKDFPKELLKTQSATAVENSSALLDMSQNSTGFVLKKTLKKILKGVLEDLQIPDDCAVNPECSFHGKVTVQREGKLKVGCVEHLAMKDTNVLHATGLATDLVVDLAPLVMMGMTLDGVARGHVEMPEVYLAIHAGKTELDIESAQTWSLSINDYENRGEFGHGGVLGGAVHYVLDLMPDIRAQLGTLVLDLLKPVIIESIQDNVEVYTHSRASRGTLKMTKWVNHMTNFAKTRHFKSKPKCPK